MKKMNTMMIKKNRMNKKSRMNKKIKKSIMNIEL